MAGSLDGRARRIRRLEERLEPGRPGSSRTEIEARALDAQIRALEKEIEESGADPDEWREPTLSTLPLDKEIAALEEMVGRCPD